MLPPINLGQIAISGDSPTGRDPKDLPEYELMSNEIARISSVQGESTVHWEKVENAATVILKDYAKDISAAAYLTMALSKNYGCAGWCTGTTILTNILITWWDNAFPPTKRMRARVNIINWWHDRSILFFSNCKEQVSSELFKEISDLISGMNDVIKTHLPDAGPLFNLREALHHVPIVGQPPSASDSESIATSSGAEVQTSHAMHSASTISQVSTQASLSSSTVTGSVNVAVPADIASGQTFLYATMQQYFSLCFDANSPPEIVTASLTWKVFYMSIWGKIQNLPPAENSQTLLPPPNADRITALFTMLDAGKYEKLIRACAFFAPEVPFCLDMQYLLCEALTKAGSQYATALAVAKREIEDFLIKFRGVESLSFSDGRPFAADIAKEFLEDLLSRPQDMKFGGGKDTVDIVAIIRSDYAENIANQDFSGAMKKIQEKSLGLRGSDLLRVKLEEIRLFLRKKHMAAAAAIANEVEAILDFHHLEQWDLVLSQEALKILRDVWSAQETSEESTVKLTQILARLYRLNPALAFL